MIRITPHRLIYALLAAGASTAGLNTDISCGDKLGQVDISAALTAALLAAYGVDIRPDNPDEYYKWSNNCVRPADWTYEKNDIRCECAAAAA